MAKKRVHVVTAVNAKNVSRETAPDGSDLFVIRNACGAVDDIVMNRVLYAGEHLAKGAPTLSDRVAPIGHPKNAAGQYISANSGDALLTAYAGAVCRNARHEGGRTLTDLHINIAMARAHPKGADVVKWCEAAVNGEEPEPMHVSTGLLADMVEDNGESRGKAYDRVATNIRYDHLALLPGGAGAGTPEQGVGMFNDGTDTLQEVETIFVVNVEPDTGKASKLLADAIELHEKHMDGTEPTAGADGEKSQSKLMRLMRSALTALGGKSGGSMKTMNVAVFPEDRRFEGVKGWLLKLLGNSELSLDQIQSGLCRSLPEGSWVREVFARYAIWTDREGRIWRQDYSVASDGSSVAFSGTAEEVREQRTYEPIANHLKGDPMKERILLVLNAAGIKTDGLSDDALMAAYNAHVGAAAAAPVKTQLDAANTQLQTLQANAQAAETAELATLATELAANSQGTLTADDFKAMGLKRCRELKANGKAAPVVTGNAATGGGGDEFAAYDPNQHFDAMKEGK